MTKYSFLITTGLSLGVVAGILPCRYGVVHCMYGVDGSAGNGDAFCLYTEMKK